MNYNILYNKSYSASSRGGSPSHSRTPSLGLRSYTLTAQIIDTEIVREGNKSHAIYIVSVMRRDIQGSEELWHVFRRYSEFHDVHQSITAKFLDLGTITFPSKRMLNNLAAWFLEKRKAELDEWLQCVLSPATLQSHPGLLEALSRFLDQTAYTTTPLPMAKRVEDNLRVGVRSVSDAVKAVPDTIINTMDGVVDGLYRKIVGPKYNPQLPDFPSRGSFDASESDENIPLRILLLLMDEVFDLRSKDQWFRRRIMLFLKQILKAMFGEIVNRRIVDYVEYVTAPEQVCT